MQVGNFQSYIPSANYGGLQPPINNPYGGSFGSVAAPGMNQLSMMFSLMQGIMQLAQGWGGFGGGQFGAAPVDYASMHFPNLQNYNQGTNPTGYGGGGGGGTGGAALPQPRDPQEFNSYIQAQIAGGALQGKTGVAQSDAIPGSRFGQVQDSTMWQASLARNYAYQFAAQAVGANPLSAQGLQQGMQAFGQMKPEAKLFMQVASVFKGDLLGGPGFYDNPGLKNLLQSKGLGQFINDPQVGKTDVQTIGAITAAINSGQLSLNEVINSGTISDLNRYQNVINYVSNGGFANDLNNYDTVPI